MYDTTYLPMYPEFDDVVIDDAAVADAMAMLPSDVSGAVFVPEGDLDPSWMASLAPGTTIIPVDAGGEPPSWRRGRRH